MSKRRSYDHYFKLEAGKLTIRADKPLAQVAREPGISSNVLFNWKSQFKNDPHFTFPSKGLLKPHDEELRLLKKQLRDAEEERDILKKPDL